MMSENSHCAKVLIVDDIAFSQDILRHFLEKRGIQVDCAGSGQQAVDIIRENKVTYDAIFIDQIMPDMDGAQTARNIRGIGTKYAGTVPFIAITADAMLGDKKAFLIKGFQDYISKPIDAVQLDVVVQRWISKDI
jgi:CheY-like chemotaxis protein